jgi:hypothetical protein
MRRLVLLFAASLLSFALIGLTGCGGDEEVVAAGPVISYVAPRNESTGVATTASVFVAFDKAINSPTAANLVFTPGVGGTVSYDRPSYTLIFKPSSPLASNTGYSFKVTGITDLGGNPMDPVTVKFKTGTTDATRPRIEHSYPEDKQKDIGPNDAVKLTFDEDIDRTKLWDGITFTPSVDREGWFLKWSLAESAVEVTPPAMGEVYDLNEDYTVVIDSDSVADLSGNTTSSDYVISFKTFRYPLEKIPNLTIPNAKLEPNWLFHVGRAGGRKWVIICGGQRPAKGPSNTTGSVTVTASADGRIADGYDFWQTEYYARTISVSKGNGNRITCSTTLDQADDYYQLIFSSSSRFLTFQVGVSKEWVHIGKDQISPERTPFAMEND